MQQENHFKRMFNKETDHFYPENTEKQAVYPGRFSLTTIGPCVPVHVIVFSFLRSYFIFHEMEKKHTSKCSYARSAQPGPSRTRLCGPCIVAIAGD